MNKKEKIKETLIKKRLSKKDRAALKEKILSFLKATPRSLGFFSRNLKVGDYGVSPRTVLNLLKQLKEEGIPIRFEQETQYYYIERKPRETFGLFSLTDVEGCISGTCRGMLVSDDHMGSRDSQFFLWEQNIIPLAEKEKVDFIAHSGDLCNSVAWHKSMDRGENRLNNADEQEELAVQILSVVDKPLWIRPGNHDAWPWASVGHNMVFNCVKRLNFEKGKKNIHYVSPVNPFFEIGNVKIELSHPWRGQTKAKSYGPVNAINKQLGQITILTRAKLDQFNKGLKESLEKTNNFIIPSVKAIGNMHTCIAVVYAGIVFFLVPCLQKRTGFERATEKWHQMGAWVFEISTDKLGRVYRLTTKYYSFDRLAREHTTEEIELQSSIHEKIMALRPEG